MSYGPGASFKLWDEFFSHPETQLNYMEINGECVHKMNIRPRNGHVFIGSQDNVTFLEADVRQHLGARGGLDVLVDDGGHTMQQQLKTFATLWCVCVLVGACTLVVVRTKLSSSTHTPPLQQQANHAPRWLVHSGRRADILF